MKTYTITSNDGKFRYKFIDCKLDIEHGYVYMINTNSELIGAFSLSNFHLTVE